MSEFHDGNENSDNIFLEKLKFFQTYARKYSFNLSEISYVPKHEIK